RVVAYQVQSMYGSSTAFTYTFYDINSQGLTKCVFEYDTNSNFGNVLSISPNWAYYIVESPSSIPNQGVPTCSGSTTLNYVCELPARGACNSGKRVLHHQMLRHSAHRQRRVDRPVVSQSVCQHRANLCECSIFGISQC